MLSNPVIAQLFSGGEASNSLMQMLPLLLIFLVFYFLLIRPQQKRMKQHREMIASLKRGDHVITAGGLKGKVVKVADDEVTIELGENIRVRAVRDTITMVTGKPEPVKAGGEKAADGETTAAKN